jgi:Domain of unknown function (DUF5658)
MNLSIPFALTLAAASVTNYLDWSTTVKLIAKNGISGESNPIMRFLMGKSKYLGLFWKAWPIALLVYAGWFFKGGDVQNFLVKYSNASGTDHWALVWIGIALFSTGVGLYGYLNNKKYL